MPIFTLGDRNVELSDECYIAYNASVIGSVSIGHHASLWFNVVVRGDSERISIGERSNIQDASVLHADPGAPLTIGNGVSVGHKAMLHGCTIGDGCLVGINSVVLNHASIGPHSIVAANTLIPESKAFPGRVLILGSPGKVVRDLSAAEVDWIASIADGYVKRAERYRRELRPAADRPPGERG